MKQYAFIVGLSMVFLATPPARAAEGEYKWSREMKVTNMRYWLCSFYFLTAENEDGAQITCCANSSDGKIVYEVPDETKLFGVRQGPIPSTVTFLYPDPTDPTGFSQRVNPFRKKSSVSSQELQPAPNKINPLSKIAKKIQESG